MSENTSNIYHDTEISWEVNYKNYLIGTYIDEEGNINKIAFYPKRYIYRDKEGDLPYYNIKIIEAVKKMIIHVKFFEKIFNEISDSIQKCEMED